MQTTRIIPQRRSKGKKWVECEAYRAQRFVLVKGMRILQVYRTAAEAKINLPSNSHEVVKPMTAGDRYKTTWRGTLISSLTQAQYLELKNRRLL
jgi:primase-polymerase (primpol)-like protein